MCAEWGVIYRLKGLVYAVVIRHQGASWGIKINKILVSAYNTVTSQFLYVILLKSAEVLVRHSRKQ